MQKSINRGIALALGIAAFAPMAAQAQVSNGGFETPVIAGNFSTRITGSSIGAWTVASGNVEIIRNTYWLPNSGNQSLDLNGNTGGSISQSIATIANHVYQITFAMAGNPVGGDPNKDLRLDFGASSANFTFNTTGFTRLGNMGWTLKQATFTATGASTLLQFTSLETGAFGPALDDVQVTDLGPAANAPEPGTIALASLGLLPLGLVLRRRK